MFDYSFLFLKYLVSKRVISHAGLLVDPCPGLFQKQAEIESQLPVKFYFLIKIETQHSKLNLYCLTDPQHHEKFAKHFYLKDSQTGTNIHTLKARNLQKNNL